MVSDAKARILAEIAKRNPWDERDDAILAERVAALDAVEGPRVGDFVRFNEGTVRRISYIWRDEHETAFNVQTSDGGSFYLGNGYVSMSGSLYSGVKLDTLTLTDETRTGSVWFFHHDMAGQDRGVGARMTFRVFECSGSPTR